MWSAALALKSASPTASTSSMSMISAGRKAATL